MYWLTKRAFKVDDVVEVCRGRAWDVRLGFAPFGRYWQAQPCYMGTENWSVTLDNTELFPTTEEVTSNDDVLVLFATAVGRARAWGADGRLQWYVDVAIYGLFTGDVQAGAKIRPACRRLPFVDTLPGPVAGALAEHVWVIPGEAMEWNVEWMASDLTRHIESAAVPRATATQLAVAAAAVGARDVLITDSELFPFALACEQH